MAESIDKDVHTPIGLTKIGNALVYILNNEFEGRMPMIAHPNVSEHAESVREHFVEGTDYWPTTRGAKGYIYSLPFQLEIVRAYLRARTSNNPKLQPFSEEEVEKFLSLYTTHVQARHG